MGHDQFFKEFFRTFFRDFLELFYPDISGVSISGRFGSRIKRSSWVLRRGA